MSIPFGGWKAVALALLLATSVGLQGRAQQSPSGMLREVLEAEVVAEELVGARLQGDDEEVGELLASLGEMDPFLVAHALLRMHAARVPSGERTDVELDLAAQVAAAAAHEAEAKNLTALVARWKALDPGDLAREDRWGRILDEDETSPGWIEEVQAHFQAGFEEASPAEAGTAGESSGQEPWSVSAVRLAMLHARTLEESQADEAAEKAYRWAARCAREVGWIRAAARAEESAGTIAMRRGRRQEACEAFESARSLWNGVSPDMPPPPCWRQRVRR